METPYAFPVNTDCSPLGSAGAIYVSRRVQRIRRSSFCNLQPQQCRELQMAYMAASIIPHGRVLLSRDAVKQSFVLRHVGAHAAQLPASLGTAATARREKLGWRKDWREGWGWGWEELVSETHTQTHKHRDRGTDIIIITSYYDVKMAPVHGDWMLSEMCASLYDSSVFFFCENALSTMPHSTCI